MATVSREFCSNAHGWCRRAVKRRRVRHDGQTRPTGLFVFRRAHKFFPLSLSLSLLFFLFFSMKKTVRGCLDCYRIRADALSQISLRIGLLLSPGCERRKRISLDRFEVLKKKKKKKKRRKTTCCKHFFFIFHFCKNNFEQSSKHTGAVHHNHHIILVLVLINSGANV